MIEHSEIDAAKVALLPHKNCFYDGPDDPAISAALAYSQDLDRRIAEAGGIDALREQHRKETA